MYSRSPITRRASLLVASLMILLVNSIGHAQETSYKASFKQKQRRGGGQCPGGPIAGD